MRVPIRGISGRWPQPVEVRFRRFLQPDPQAISDDNATPAAFRAAMSTIHVGPTIKITEADRHPEADELLLANVALSEARIVDIGASDGSTSVDLIRRLPGFASYVIADLYLTVEVTRVGSSTLFYDHEGHCILVAGRRTLAWPGRSRGVAALYRPLIELATLHPERRRPVLLLNPEARALMARDPRVTHRAHDVFTPWPAPAPTVIKVANLLRRLYFSDGQITAALRTLRDSLDEGGYLLIADNPRRPGGGARGGLYRRRGDRLVAVARTDEFPEIDDLVRNVGEKWEQALS